MAVENQKFLLKENMDSLDVYLPKNPEVSGQNIAH